MPLYPPSSAGTPGGSDTQVQFNDGGAFGGDAGLLYDKTNNLLTHGSLYTNTDWGSGATLPATLRSSGDKSIFFWNPKKGAFWAGEWDINLASSDVGDSSTALGYSNKASGYGSLATGTGNITTGDYSLVAGDSNSASADSSMTTGVSNINSALGGFVTGIDNELQSTGNYTAIFGHNNVVSGDESLIAGNGNSATGDNTVMLGTSHISTGAFATIIGNDSNVTADETVSIGNDVDISGTGSVGIGIFLDISGTGTVVIGRGSGDATPLATSANNALLIGMSQFGAFLDTTSIAASHKTFTFPNTTGTIDVTASSIRFKKKVKTMATDALDLVKDLRPVEFTYKDNDRKAFGLIAEEVEKIDPRLVMYDKDGQPTGVYYTEFTAVLAKAVQQVSACLDDMERRLQALEAPGAMKP